MFKSLKERLKGWTEKISKSKKSEETEGISKPIEAKQKIPKETPKEEKRKNKTTKQPEKKEKEISEEEKAETAPIRKSKEETPKEKWSLFGKTGKVKITEKDFENYKEDLEFLLLENNVAFEVSDEIIKKLGEKIVGKEILKKELESEIKNTLGEIISDILVEPSFDIIDEIAEKNTKSKEPFVILFFGINGSGKTTGIAKLAEFLKKKKLSSVLAAADTFRAASIEQLKEHGEKLGTKVIAHEYGSDPASVGFDAIQYAKKNHIDCVLIDTAGRMHTEKNLIHEMEKISKVCKPDLKIFIGESITGNDATEQARTFNEKIGIDGIILSKADIDEKGGTALSVGFVTGKPIIFLGTGQKYSDIEPFNKNKFLDKLGL